MRQVARHGSAAQTDRGGRSRVGLVAVTAEQRLERQEDWTLIIDDQDATVFGDHACESAAVSFICRNAKAKRWGWGQSALTSICKQGQRDPRNEHGVCRIIIRSELALVGLDDSSRPMKSKTIMAAADLVERLPAPVFRW